MKNSTLYQKNIKKLLSGVSKKRIAPPEVDDLVRLLIEAVLSPDTSRKLVQQGVEAMSREFVDFNELRVSPPKEIVDRMGRNVPHAREKADTLVRVLNAVFDRTSTMTMDYMKEMSKKDLRRHLAEIGLSPYSAAHVLLLGFASHAVAVDVSLLDALKMGEFVAPNCDIEEATGFLERFIAQKEALATHEFFRTYIEHNAKAIAKWRKANPDLASQEAPILPPPKFQMMAKSQPLPPMKGEEGYEGAEDDVPVDLVEVVADIDEIDGPEGEAAEVEVEDFEVPLDEAGAEPPMKAPPKKPAAKAAKPTPPRKGPVAKGKGFKSRKK